MIDVTTNKPLQVRKEGETGPYLRVPASQFDQPRELLDRHGIYYWVHESFVAWTGDPLRGVVEFGRKGDPEAIQRVIDEG